MAQLFAGEDDSATYGHQLSHPPPGEEIYITGISGRFPESDSVDQLKNNLFDKIDMVSDDDRRWKPTNPEIPRRAGKVNNLNKFDAGFFGVLYNQVYAMDPGCRILLEKTYEAIIDAGINPKELRNTKCGVFVGSCFADSDKTWLYEKMHPNGFAITGSSRAMLANRISFWLGVNGPSYTIDSACSSSLFALEHAFRAIRNGQCDSAIVCGSNLCLLPGISLQFSRLGVLSPDGKCKCFDNSANGYARSEAVVSCFLQKAKDSRRVYAQLLYAKTNCDGYKDQGITYPSGNMQMKLLEEFYEDCSISPSSVEYMEAHGTGTQVGDLEELKAMDKNFCTGRPDSLLIGSIKSNMGHCEAASGICSLIKLCIAYHTGYIPANLHYKTPREGVEGLKNGRLQVVTETTPWNRGLFAANNFGFGGANAHVLLKNVARKKVNNGLPSDNLPRLVCVSGRTESAVAKILDYLESKTVDVELTKLWHSVHQEDIGGHIYRGYTLLRSLPTRSVSLSRGIQYFSGERRPVWFVYSGMGSQWAGMAAELMAIPVFATAIQNCHQILEPRGINLIHTITNPDIKIYDNILNSFIGIAAVQIGLTDVLRSIGIVPDYMIGHSFGELGCAYADGCLTAEQMILAAYSRGLASLETTFIKGSMASIGLGYNQVKEICPSEIEVACHNGPNSCTISGPADAMKSFITQLIAQKIFAKEVPCSNIAYHSRYIAEAGPKLQKYLEQVIPSPKPRSERWFSTSIPLAQWHESKAQLSSAEYHTNNFMSPVLFEEAARLIRTNAIVIEIAPHGLLRSILRSSLKNDVINITLMQRNNKDCVQVLFTALGKLYEVGLNPRLASIYPHVPFPVSQSTPMMANLVEWEHSENWYVTSHKAQDKIKFGDRLVRMSVQDKESQFLTGHIVDERNLYPAAGYLVMVWETLGMMLGVIYTEVSVVFENVTFHRATNIPKNDGLEFSITIHKSSGNFEIAESGTSVVTGRIYAKENVEQNYPVFSSRPNITDIDELLLKKDFYKELRLRGYQFSGLFRGVIDCNIEGTLGHLSWSNNWVTFLDGMMQIKIIDKDTRDLYVPTTIEKLLIDVSMHYESINSLKCDKMAIEVQRHPDTDVIRAGGVEIRGVHGTPITKKNILHVPILEKYEFVPNFRMNTMKMEDILRVIMQLVLENVQIYSIKCLEVFDNEYKVNKLQPVIETIHNILADIPLINAKLSIYSQHNLKMPCNIIVENKKLQEESNIVVLIGANFLIRPEVLEQGLSTLRDGCFIISRETNQPDLKGLSEIIDIIAKYDTGVENVILFRKKKPAKPTKFIKINSTDIKFAWIEEIKEEMKNDNQKIVLFCQDETVDGLLGLVNCLRKEPGGNIFHGFLLMYPSASTFDPDLEIYKRQLNKNLAINVLQNGQWGTYRHLLLQDVDKVKATHAYVNSLTIGDLSSLTWIEGPITENIALQKPTSILVHVYCSALNFRDVMIATGRITVDAFAQGRRDQQCLQGIEIVGRTTNGNRVMCYIQGGGISNAVEADSTLSWVIPDKWTFEEAATIPVAYGTVYYAMVMVGQLKRGESVLIHAGSGGVGQAAINIALHYGCEVFTTVGTDEKRAFIKKLYPQLKDTHIGNSRNILFENMIRKQTNGQGVDMVLNSLSEEKLQASIRCLGAHGRFLEIGKFDMTKNTQIGMYHFLKGISFHGIVFDKILNEESDVKKTLQNLVQSGIKSGAVRPLTYHIFEKEEIEAAYRFMASGKHIGKVIIKIRDEERSCQYAKPALLEINAFPRYLCNGSNVYIIIGGLGGFGLELADWLIIRGARKLVLASRKGVSNGYQSFRIRIWKSYGTDVKISTHDVSTEAGCKNLIKLANSMGQVEAIFNLAVILEDAIFQNQTSETFKTSFKPKALATMFLDKCSRLLCPQLRDFVVFSSVSCGRGNAGQTNYGFSNSAMERICESRKHAGYPALAVQWGPVEDVGIVADHDIKVDIAGTLKQNLRSCLETLDTFLRQNATIVSSTVVAEKNMIVLSCESPVQTIAQIMGIKDLKTVSQQASLAELGMDSMMAVEINQTLQRKFEIFLTAQEVRQLTFAKLYKLSPEQSSLEGSSLTQSRDHDHTVDFKIFINTLGDEIAASEPFVYMPTMISDGTKGPGNKNGKGNVMFMLPGLLGDASVLKPLCKRLKTNVCVLQLGFEYKNENRDQMVNRLYEIIKTQLLPGVPFKLFGYSFGCSLIFSLAKRLEKDGHTGVVFCLDGSPEFTYAVSKMTVTHKNDFQLQNSIIYHIIDILIPNNHSKLVLTEILNEIESFEERINTAIKMSSLQDGYSNHFIASVIFVCYDRIKAILNYNRRNGEKIESPVILLRTKKNIADFDIGNNYGLDKYTKADVTVHYLESNHISIIDNEDCANIINTVLANKDA